MYRADWSPILNRHLVSDLRGVGRIGAAEPITGRVKVVIDDGPRRSGMVGIGIDGTHDFRAIEQTRPWHHGSDLRTDHARISKMLPIAGNFTEVLPAASQRQEPSAHGENEGQVAIDGR